MTGTTTNRSWASAYRIHVNTATIITWNKTKIDPRYSYLWSTILIHFHFLVDLDYQKPLPLVIQMICHQKPALFFPSLKDFRDFSLKSQLLFAQIDVCKALDYKMYNNYKTTIFTRKLLSKRAYAYKNPAASCCLRVLHVAGITCIYD